MNNYIHNHPYRLKDFIQFNPKEKLPKGAIARKITMEQLSPNNRYVESNIFEEYKGGSKFRNGDTIMARITPCLENGKTAYITSLNENELAFGSTEFIVFREIEGKSNSKYIYYLLKTPQIRDIAIKSMVGSSGRQRVQQNVLENYEVLLPTLDKQIEIASILSSLDDKIELNRRINENLEQQAQALFKSWFVDNKNNELQYYELGDITFITAGGDKPSVYSKDLTEQCRIPIYSNGIENEGLYGYTTSAKINSSSITISARGTIGYVCLRTEPYVPIVRLISVVPNIENLSAEYLYLWALTQNINGTGTTQQQLTVPNFRHTLIGIPTKEIMIRFNNIVFPIFQRIVINKNENKILSQLRDTLLPRLMSGKLEIKDNSYD